MDIQEYYVKQVRGTDFFNLKSFLVQNSCSLFSLLIKKYGYIFFTLSEIRLCMDNNPCRDNSTCIPLTSEPFYKCLCSSGKTGVRCEIDEGTCT